MNRWIRLHATNARLVERFGPNALPGTRLVDGQKYENEMKRHTAFLILKHLGHASGLDFRASLSLAGWVDLDLCVRLVPKTWNAPCNFPDGPWACLRIGVYLKHQRDVRNNKNLVYRIVRCQKNRTGLGPVNFPRLRIRPW